MKKTLFPQFADLKSSSIFFDVAVFLLSSLVTAPSFMTISWLALELWQCSFIKDWPEFRKSEIHPSEFFPISGDWVGWVQNTKFGMSVSHKTLLNATKRQGYSFHRFGVIMGKLTSGRIIPTQIRVRNSSPGQFFLEPQLTQISLNFETACCNF